MNEFLIALGANLDSSEGPPTTTLKAAISALDNGQLSVAEVSRFYSTPCFPAGAGPDYVNAAVRITSNLPPRAVLARLHEIEARFGRERQERWGMRTLDLDLIAAGDTVLPDPETFEHWRNLPDDLQRVRIPEEVILPHPRLQDRAFVLVPLADIASNWRHPVLGRTIKELCDALSPDALAEIVPIAAG